MGVDPRTVLDTVEGFNRPETEPPPDSLPLGSSSNVPTILGDHLLLSHDRNSCQQGPVSPRIDRPFGDQGKSLSTLIDKERM